jgi:hypothetical protein
MKHRRVRYNQPKGTLLILEFTPEVLQLLQKAFVLFEKHLATSQEVLANKPLAWETLTELKRKMRKMKEAGEWSEITLDANEVLIISASVSMFSTGLYLLPPSFHTASLIRQCNHILAQITLLSTRMPHTRRK